MSSTTKLLIELFVFIQFPDKDIGFVVLGSSMLAKGSGEEHWNKAIQIPKETIVMWHNLSPDSL